jgi:hypothetical protein
MKNLFIFALVIMAAIECSNIAQAQELNIDESAKILQSSTGLGAITNGESSLGLMGYDAVKYAPFIIAGDKAAQGYAESARDATSSNGVIARSLFSFYTRKSLAQGAAQVSQLADEATVRLQAMSVAQNQRIIEQNDQIITLLKQIANKK